MHYLKNGTIFEKNVIETKMCVSIFSTVLSNMYFSFAEELSETGIFEKYSNIKFHENPSSGSRVVP